MNSLGFRVEGEQLEFTISATSREAFENAMKTIRLVSDTVWPAPVEKAPVEKTIDLTRDPADVIDFRERMGLA